MSADTLNEDTEDTILIPLSPPKFSQDPCCYYSPSDSREEATAKCVTLKKVLAGNEHTAGEVV